MKTLLIELTNPKAINILNELENLGLIKIIKKSTKLSSLRGKIQTKMSNEDINRQLHILRGQ
jgi:hypothetical protein